MALPRGYLIDGFRKREILISETAERFTTLRWFDVGHRKLRRELKKSWNDEFLGGGTSTSGAGDGVVAGNGILFTNKVGTLRRYPDVAILPTATITQYYSAALDRDLLQVGDASFLALPSRSGLVYKPFLPSDSLDFKQGSPPIKRLWASQDWILRNLGSEPSLWMVSRSDGSHDQFLAYGNLTACGQPLMGDYALDFEEDEGYAVTILSLRPDLPDYRIPRIPLDKPYCPAGHDGTVAVTGRYEGHPAIAIHQDGAWQRVLLPDSPSVLEPVVKDGRIIVSAPEERSSESVKGSFVPSVGGVYVLVNDGGTWKLRTKIIPPTARQHAYFGYKVVPMGRRLFINYLADHPKRVSDPAGWGVPSVCEAELPDP
jgi:hypothetical protein